MNCKFCRSENLVKYGKRGTVQYYLCRSCKHTFAGNNTIPGMRFAPEHIAASMHMFYDGCSIDAIRIQLKARYNVYPSDSTVYKWIVRFTEIASKLIENLKAKVGDLWIVGETVLKLNEGKAIWLWDVMDDETRFLLASCMPVNRTIHNSKKIMAKAVKAAGHTPKIINLDKGRAFLDGVEIIFGDDTGSLEPEGVSLKHNLSSIKRFHMALESRTKIFRRMKNVEISKLVMDGWLVHYNFFSLHEELNSKTPGEVAKATFPYHSWKELIIGANLIDNR